MRVRYFEGLLETEGLSKIVVTVRGTCHKIPGIIFNDEPVEREVQSQLALEFCKFNGITRYGRV